MNLEGIMILPLIIHNNQQPKTKFCLALQVQQTLYYGRSLNESYNKFRISFHQKKVCNYSKSVMRPDFPRNL